LPWVCSGEKLRDFSIAKLSSLMVRREKTLLEEFRPEGQAAATCTAVSVVLLILSRNFRRDEYSAELSDDAIVGRIVTARRFSVRRGGLEVVGVSELEAIPSGIATRKTLFISPIICERATL
jgi:hypothetical protein